MASRLKGNLVVWAARLLVLMGVIHVVDTLLLSRVHVGELFQGAGWNSPGGKENLTPAAGAFWLSLGSFGVPLILLGLLLARLGHEGRRIPAYVGWGIAVWGAACAALFEPAPLITTLIPAAMLIVAAHRGARRSEAVSSVPTRVDVPV